MSEARDCIDVWAGIPIRPVEEPAALESEAATTSSDMQG